MRNPFGKDPLFENKLAALLLVAALLVFAPPLAIHKLFSARPAPPPETIDQTPDSAAQELALRLQNASATRGARITSACISCHSFEPDGGHRLGPNLYCVYGRQIGGADGFGYSAALRNADSVWSEEQLDLFLAAPQNAFPGTTMGLAVSDPDKRADIIRYLQSLPETSDSEKLCVE